MRRGGETYCLSYYFLAGRTKTEEPCKKKWLNMRVAAATAAVPSCGRLFFIRPSNGYITYCYGFCAESFYFGLLSYSNGVERVYINDTGMAFRWTGTYCPYCRPSSNQILLWPFANPPLFEMIGMVHAASWEGKNSSS